MSTEDQECENQIIQLKEYASKNRWNVVDVVMDKASGGLDKSARKGLDKVFNLAHRKKFDVLLFWSLDRLSREGSRKTIAYLETLEGYGVDWHSYTENYISSLGIFSDAIIALLSALAQQEKVRISERTKAGISRARKENPHIHFGRPKTDPRIINQVIELRAQGLSYSAISKEVRISSSRAHQIIKDQA